MNSNLNKQNSSKDYAPVPMDLDIIGKKVVDAAFHVYKNLGPGPIEKVYEICFCYELEKRGLNYERQVDISIKYESMTFSEGLRLDVMVEDCIICELKALENVHPVWEAQILSQMKITGIRLGYLINFNVVTFSHGIRRFVL